MIELNDTVWELEYRCRRQDAEAEAQKYRLVKQAEAKDGRPEGAVLVRLTGLLRLLGIRPASPA